MDLIRYQPLELAPWSALDRWSNLRNELNSLFKMPLESTFGRGGQAERTERYVGAFRRSITLPTRVDASKVSETYKDGILKVTLPKAEEAKPKQIQVT